MTKKTVIKLALAGEEEARERTIVRQRGCPGTTE